jgi:hypothetical protein
MVLFFSRNKYHFKGCVLYFGCIKYSCFMCAHFLRAYGIISTRGCHGRLFKRWTVPEAASLEAGQAERIARAVIQLEKYLEKTSVVGRSSVFNRNDASVQRRKRELEQRQMKAKQERVTEIFRR